MNDDVASALAAAFPDREVETVEEPGPSWNETNETVRVTFADGEVVFLKLAVDGDRESVVREQAVVEFVRANLPVPAPEVVASEVDREIPYLVTAPLPGTPLHEIKGDLDDAGHVELARQVGRALGTVHGETFEAHGTITGGGAGGLAVEHDPWTDVLLDIVRDQRERAVSDRYDHYYDDVLEAVEANRDLLDEAPATLLHGDPAGPNTILDGDDVGFIDWEVSTVGDPSWELVRGRDQQLNSIGWEAPDERLTAFHDGYREARGSLPDGFEDRRPVYEAVWFLSRVGFFDNYLSFVQASEAEFADFVETEMERRLEAIR